MLRGELAACFGPAHEGVFDTVTGAILMMARRHHGFLSKISGSYTVVVKSGSNEYQIDEHQLTMSLGNYDEVYLIPVPSGAKDKGVGKIIASMALLALTFATAGGSAAFFSAMKAGTMSLTTKTLFGIAVSTFIGGVTALLAPSPRTDTSSTTASNESYLFNGDTNNSEEGQPEPLALGGPILCGSFVASTAIETEEMIRSQSGNPFNPADPNLGGVDFDYSIGGLSGGGGKGAGSSARSAREAPNTHQTEAIAKIVEIISSGEIAGFVDETNPMKCIYFDKTPVQNADGSFNFTGVEFQARYGLPDQDYLTGFDDVSSLFSVATVVRAGANNAVTRSINYDPSAPIDRVRVTLRWNSMTELNTENGDLNGSSVHYRIHIVPNGGAAVTVVDHVFSAKFTSPSEKTWTFPLPTTGHPYLVRVERMSPDPSNANVQNEMTWSSYTEILDVKQTHPMRAVIGMKALARLFGDRIPNRGYLMNGVITEVPVNYDPETLTYTGIWNGQFKMAFTSNPVWILWGLLTNKVWGLGNQIPRSIIDRYSFYAPAVISDQLVSDGRGGTEPRFRYAKWVGTRTDTRAFLQAVASSFRGKLIWGKGGIMVSQDVPRQPVRIITKANVRDGRFTYEQVAEETIRTVTAVSWINPQDAWQRNVFVVENPELLIEKGRRVREVVADGCTSPRQARDFGRWVTYSEYYNNDTVSFESDDSLADLIPGNVVLISDEDEIGSRHGGRIKSFVQNASTTQLILDAPFQFIGGVLHKIHVVLANGGMWTADYTSGSTQTTDTITVQATPPSAIGSDFGSLFAITNTNAAPSMWTVESISEKDNGILEFACVKYAPEKYTAIDEDTPIELPPENLFESVKRPGQPQNVVVERAIYKNPVNDQEEIRLSWDTVDSPLLRDYEVRYRYRNGIWMSQTTAFPYTSIPYQGDGNYEFLVTAFDIAGRPGAATLVSDEFTGRSRNFPTISNLRISGQQPNVLVFSETELRVEWDLTPPNGITDTNYSDPYFLDYEVRVLNGPTTIGTFYTTDKFFRITEELNRRMNSGAALPSLTVSVRIRDRIGGFSTAATKTFENQKPAAPTCTVSPGLSECRVNVSRPSDTDVSECVIWVYSGSFDQNAPVSQVSRDYQFAVSLAEGQTLKARVAFRDVFSRSDSSLNASGEITLSTQSVLSPIASNQTLLNTVSSEVVAARRSFGSLFDSVSSAALTGSWSQIVGRPTNLAELDLSASQSVAASQSEIIQAREGTASVLERILVSDQRAQWNNVTGRPINLSQLDSTASTLLTNTSSELIAARGTFGSVGLRLSDESTQRVNADGALSQRISVTETAFRSNQNLLQIDPSGNGTGVSASTTGWGLNGHGFTNSYWSGVGGAMYQATYLSGYSASQPVYSYFDTPVNVGGLHTASLSGFSNVPGGTWYLEALPADKSSTLAIAAGGTFGDERTSVTIDAPSNTAFIRWVFSSSPGSTGGQRADILARNLKLEFGSVSTAFTENQLRFTDLRTRVTNVETQVTTNNSAAITRLNALETSVNHPSTGLSSRALQSSLTTVESNLTSSIATNRQQMEAEFRGADSALLTNINTRATLNYVNQVISDEQGARATAVSSLVAEDNALKSRATALEGTTASLSANKADVSALNTLTATVNSNEATNSEFRTSQTNINSSLSGRAAVLEASVATGSPGPNLVPNSALFSLDGYQWTTVGTGPFDRGLNLTSWGTTDNPTGWIHCGANAVPSSTVIDERSPRFRVLPNRRYGFAARLAPHRATASVRLDWYNLTDTYIGSSALVEGGMEGGASNGNPALFNTVGAYTTSPSNSVFARIAVRLRGRGEDVPYLFWQAMDCWLASEGQTALRPYQDGPPLDRTNDLVAATARIAAEEIARASADTALASRTSTLEARSVADQQADYLPNGGWLRGTSGWTLPASASVDILAPEGVTGRRGVMITTTEAAGFQYLLCDIPWPTWMNIDLAWSGIGWVWNGGNQNATLEVFISAFNGSVWTTLSSADITGIDNFSIRNLRATAGTGYSQVRLGFFLGTASGINSNWIILTQRLSRWTGVFPALDAGPPALVATEARIANEETVRSDADNALASRASTLEAQISGSSDSGLRARIATEESARASADNALASRASTLEAQISGSSDSGLRARIATEENARASADNTLASRASALEAITRANQNLLLIDPSGNGSGNPVTATGWNVNGHGIYNGFWAPIGGLIYFTSYNSGYTSSGHLFTHFDTPVSFGGNYTFSLSGSTTLPGATWYLEALNADRTAILAQVFSGQFLGDTRSSLTIAAPSDTRFIRFVFQSGPGTTSGAYADIVLRNLKLEAGSVATAFVEGGRRFTETVARIATEEGARASADNALAGRASTLEAQMAGSSDSGLSARIVTEEGARASADNALAGRASTLEAQISVEPGAWSQNSNFADWPTSSQPPTGWLNWSNWNLGYTRIVGSGSPWAYEQTNPAGTVDYGIQQVLHGRMSRGWWVIEADVTLVSGTLVGAGIHVNFADVNLQGWGSHNLVLSSDITIQGSAPGAGVTGRRYRWAKLVEVNQPCESGNIYAMTNWQSFATSGNAKTIIWNMARLRPATDSEIELRQARGSSLSVGARITTEEGARASGDNALASRASTLESQISGVSDSGLRARIATEESTRAEADSALATRTSALEVTTTRRSNLVRGGLPPLVSGNSGYNWDAQGWESRGLWNHGYSAFLDGPFLSLILTLQSGYNWVMLTNSFMVIPGRSYSIQAILGKFGGWVSGTIGIALHFYSNSAGNAFLSSTTVKNFEDSSNVNQLNTSEIKRVTFPNIIVPAGAVTARVGIWVENATGNGAYTEAGAWFIKAEQGSNCTIWSDEGVEGTLAARIINEEGVRANADGALAGRASTLEAQMSGVSDSGLRARIASEEVARTNADSALATRTSSLEATARANQNLLAIPPSGDGSGNPVTSTGWNSSGHNMINSFFSTAGGLFYYAPYGSGYNSSGNIFTHYDAPISFGGTYTFSLNGYHSLPGGSWYLESLNADRSQILNSVGGGQLLGDIRSSLTITTPGDARFIRFVFVSGPGTTNGSYADVVLRNLKLEAGSVATAFVEGGRRLTDIVARIATEENVRATEDSALASSINTVSANLGSTNATVSSHTGAIATLQGATAWLEQVVSASGGDLAAFRMRAGQGGSFIELVSTVIRLANVTNGQVIEVMRAINGRAFFTNPISIDVGDYRATFGPNSALVIWYGLKSINPADQTISNAQFSLGVDGQIRVAGQVLPTGVMSMELSAYDANLTRVGAGNTSTSVTATGYAPGTFTYLWELHSGAAVNISAPSAQTTNIGHTLAIGEDKSSVVKCTITSSAGPTAFRLFSISSAETS